MTDITAICVTRGKAEKVRLAINCWRHQTVASRLVIVHQGLQQWDDALTMPGIQLIEGRYNDTLGELRNLGLDAVQTDYWGQLDDDDLHRPMRFEVQLDELKRHPNVAACMLSRWTLYDQITDRAWYSYARAWEGSIVARKSALRYPPQSIGEDSVFCDALGSNVALVNCPGLYVYRCHGKNTYSRNHFMALAERSKVIRAAHSLGTEFTRLESAIL